MEGAIRTLFLTDRYLPETGGSIAWFFNVYRRYPAGHVWIATRDYPGAARVDAASPGIATTRLDLRKSRFLRPASLPVILKLLATGRKLVRRHAIEVIHAGKILPEGFVARWVAKLAGIPYAVYAHGEEITLLTSNPAYRRHDARLRAVYRDAAAVIANSRFTRERLLDFGVEPRNVVQISPGVDSSFFAPAGRDPGIERELDLAGRLVLLSVGRLQERKGHDRVIRALPRLLGRFPNLVYLIVGDGEERSNLQRLAAGLGVEAAIRFAGEVSTDALPRLYNTCDVFILANRALASGDVEGFGIVLLEANACAKPVIAGDTGGTADPVREGHNGFRIDASDPAAVEEAVARLASDPSLRLRLGGNGRRLVEAEYRWEQVTERIAALGLTPPAAALEAR